MKISRRQLRRIIRENTAPETESSKFLKEAIDDYLAEQIEMYVAGGQDVQDSKVRRKIFKDFYVIIESQFKTAIGGAS